MQLQSQVKSVVAGLVFGAATLQAPAAPVTLNASGLTNKLNAGQHQGTFDGTQLLPATSRFSIESLTFTFSFSDDSTDPFTQAFVNQTSLGAVETVSGKNITSTTTYTNNYTQTGEKESATVSFGGTSFPTGQTSPTIPSFVTSTPVEVSRNTTTVYRLGNSGNPCSTSNSDPSCKAYSLTTIVQQANKTTITDYTGTFDIAGNLLDYDWILESLQLNRQLAFSIDVTGDLNLMSAALSIDFSALTPPSGIAVPEPNSLALLAAGMFAVLGLKKTRRSKR